MPEKKNLKIYNHMKYILTISVAILLASVACKTKSVTPSSENQNTEKGKDYFVNMYGDTVKKIVLSPDEWKKKLTPEEYYVLREKGTERAFTSKLNENKKAGLYVCKGCGQVLFHSKHKFDSGTGWPSFFDVLDANTFTMDTDHDIGYARTEVMCGKCGGHLGHVFPDGPQPTGLRYCINGVSLDFVKEENAK